MRTKKGEKEKKTLEIIIKTAGLLKKNGISNSGVDEIMGSMGLTSGALYSHFKSKEELFSKAILYELEFLKNFLNKKIEESPVSFVEWYLSIDHCEDISGGSILEALSSEFGRMPMKTRKLIEHHYIDLIDGIANRMPEGKKTRMHAQCLFSALVGALSLSRIVLNPKSRDEILNSGKQTALKLISSNK